MNFEMRPTRNKGESSYKTIYLKRSLIEQINKIAKANQTSFNHVIVSMIESCLEDK